MVDLTENLEEKANILFNKANGTNGCDLTKEAPYHAIPTTPLYICCDARKDSCAYHLEIKIDTKYISFQQSICAYNMRKRKNGDDI